MAFTFDHIEARDPNIPSLVASNASILIFEPGDETKTPLVITDTSGSPLPNPVQVNALGYGPAFMHATLDRVAWAGGGYTGFFTSYEGMKQVAVDAKAAAENAEAGANAAASTVVTQAAVNGSGRLILKKADETTVDAGPVIGPKGDKGDKGNDGANVLPTDTAIKQAIENPSSDTRGALNATFVTAEVDATGGVTLYLDGVEL
ncbi:hypothetical protein G9E11_01805 [Arthrobacter sp. IA7]|uniref:hypothetical protein n=1 Tax=Arthrobacter ipis TaxID=2716202 RepID=UPI0016830DFD|nr:hypothetical protein [Arthrobacter ipis]MBD1541008.1 hypothetical protein [Arthrobacter ipis]